MGLFSSLAPMAGMGIGALVGGPVGAAVGGGIGGAFAGNAKHEAALDRQRRSAQLAADTARYSPWTGMKPGAIEFAGSGVEDIGGGALGGAMTGYSLGSAWKAKPVTPTAPDLSGSAKLTGALPGQSFAAPAPSYLGVQQPKDYSPWTQTMFSNRTSY